jgi:hypothetical protein
MENKGQFKKGLIPWNKGKKDFRPSPETEFKVGDGHEGKNHSSWRGGVQKFKVDCVHVWTAKGQRKRRPRMVYEEANGVIPNGYVIIHLDGNKNNDELSNLEAISRSELMKRNNPKL